MTDAPERIWAFYAPEIADDNNGATIVAHEAVQHGAQPYRRADLPRPEDAARIAELEAENARLRAGLALLDKAAADTIRYGAQTGPQWSRLTIASLKARAALAADKENKDD